MSIVEAWGIYIGACVVVWAVFVKFDGLLQDDTKLAIAVWLVGDPKTEAPPWPDTFIRLFDRAFGEKHLSWKCFWRSSIASFLAMCGLLALGYAVNPAVRAVLDLDAEMEPVIVAAIIIGAISVGGILNLFPDYLSLLQTRFVLRCMSRHPGTLRRVAWLLIDLFLTFVIVTIALGILGLVYVAIGVIQGPIWLMWLVMITDLIPTGLAMIFGGQTPGAMMGVYIYSTLVTSVWIWLYLLSGLIVKAAYRVHRLRAFIDKHLDVTQQPLSVMGGALVVLLTVTYWPLYVLSDWGSLTAAAAG